MKRYDLSKVMKGAHNMYRTGKYASFSAALKRSWKVVKFSAGIKACLPAVEAGIAEKERINAKRKAWVKQVEDERGKRCIHVSTPAKERNSVQIYYSPCSIWSMNTNYTGD